MPFDWIGYGFTVVVATGGIIGYIKAGSIMSLVAGLLFGIMSGVGTFQKSQNSRNIWLLLLTYGTLTTVMGVRYLSSWKAMPAGYMTGTSLLMFLRILLGFLRLQKKTS